MGMETIRDSGVAICDERLGEALTLLQKPRNARPGYVPLLAACAFIGASTFLAYVATKSPALEKPVQAAPKAVQSANNAVANKADFELSGTSGASAEPSVTEAVLLGTEQSR